MPSSFIDISNFYTLTVYEKGAEVVRMIEKIVGEEEFIKGVQFYLRTYDGQCATVNDFIWCMEQSSKVNLQQFKLWYTQAGYLK